MFVLRAFPLLHASSGTIREQLRAVNAGVRRVIQCRYHSATRVESMAEARAAASPARVAVGQMTATSDTETNFQTCAMLAKEAQAQGLQLLSLPECFSFIGTREGEAMAIAEPLSGPILERYRNLAKETGLWLALGGYQEERDEGPGSRIFNTHVLLDSDGSLVTSYRKIHLFDVDVPGGPVLMESRGTAAGRDLCCADSPVGRLGLTVCYDLRFPYVYQALRFNMGAEILLVPSAFTVKTGQAHWEVLLRARAIECQCYVLAAAQAGRHNERRESYGDALIVDPWGTVIARCKDPLSTGLAVADIDHAMLATIRSRMPIAEHRKPEICPRPSSGVDAEEPGDAKTKDPSPCL